MTQPTRGIDLFRLDGRIALVTGGSRGLGKSMAQGLASAGARVVVCGRTLGDAEKTAAEIEKQSGQRTLGVACDVTKEDEVQRLVDLVVKEFGTIHILINNAGINKRGAIENLSLDDFETVLRTNTVGPWLCCRAAAPHLRRQKYGRVINIASTLGVVAVARRTPYASSKGAVVMMTRVLALEWAQEGITVNAICPGPFLTEMNIPIADNPETKAVIVGATALGRWAELHEIQGAAIFLSSDASSYVTGTTLFVDGGWTAR